MQKLRIAVIGAGRLGGFHAQKITQRRDATLVAVVDPLPVSRQRVATECRTEARADCTGLAGRIDAAVIATPATDHYRVAKNFLSAGVHLLVEKPLCTSRADADDLVALARRRGAVLQVGHVERFNPAFNAAAAQLAQPKYIEALRATEVTLRSTDVGVVLDLMIHDIDLVLSLVHSPLLKVDAPGASILGGHEDVANARLEFECGCVAALSASRISYEAVRRMHVWSARSFGSIDFASRTATVVYPSETLLRRRFRVDGLTPDQLDHHRRHFTEEHLPRQQLNYEAVDALALELDDFIQSIRTHRRPRVDGEAGRDAVAVAAEILARIGAHRWESSPDGVAGPLARPGSHVIPTPHFHLPTNLPTTPSPIVSE